MVSISEKEAYLEGRLLGLEELITLLKELVNTEGIQHESLVKTLVSHISQEMDEIIDGLRGVQETKKDIAPQKAKMESVLKKLRNKRSELKKKVESDEPIELEDEIKSADELMKDLMDLKKTKKSPEDDLEELVE